MTPIILIVDSDTIVRSQIAEYLRQCGYKVIEAVDGEEAILALGQATIDVDIALVDVQLAGKFDGFVVSRWVRTNRPNIKVVLAGSVAKTAEQAGELCEDGPNLTKPYDHQLLLNQIKRMLRK